MARSARGRPEPETPGQPSIPPDRAIVILTQQVQQATTLVAQTTITEPDYEVWQNDTREFLAQSFGRNTDNISRVVAAGRTFAHLGEADYTPHYKAALQTQIALLNGCIRQLREKGIVWTTPERPIASPTPSRSTNVFVVHGHDEAPKEGVARLLSQLGLHPVILHEQPNKGRTIIEKFEDYANVNFTVVLLTLDDRGGRSNELFEAQHPRARQNVWLELGFFLGKLGRASVCALYRRGVEIPSDYQGVVLVELDDSGAWKYRLAEELQAAGYQVDMNKVLG